MKSILCDDSEVKHADNLATPAYFISARVANLLNLSEQVSSLDLQKPKQFQTILTPSLALQNRYKTILSLPPDEPLETGTQTKNLRKNSNKNPKKSKKPSSKKNFIKSNKEDLKVSSSLSSVRPSSLKTTPREGKKNVKHVTITEPESGRQTSNIFQSDPGLLSLFFKQFSDLVLEQWEEAADLLIEEVLEEEIEFLNKAEGASQETHLFSADFSGVLEEIGRIESFKQGMKEKYLLK
jgi:hypothetical protein